MVLVANNIRTAEQVAAEIHELIRGHIVYTIRGDIEVMMLKLIQPCK